MSESSRDAQLHCWFSHVMPHQQGRIAQSVMCLAADMCLTADPGVASTIRARSHIFVEIDREIISTVILLLQLNQEWFLSVTSESMCTKYWLTA